MKKLFILILIFYFSIPIYSQILETGSFKANFENQNFTLHEGKGLRTFSLEVNFKKHFDKIPQIILSVNSLDASVLSNIRYKVKPAGVSRDGFIIKIETWSDSKIYNIEGNWIAIIKEPEE